MKLTISRCPMCDSSQVVREIGEFVTHDGYHIPTIEYEHCKNCGEKFYDKEASQAIDNTLRAAGRLGKRLKAYKYSEVTAPMLVSENAGRRKYSKRKLTR